MKLNCRIHPAALACTMTLAVLTCGASGQWSGDPAANLLVADLANDQIQPKVRAAPDGGSYISWFDNATGGYDVYLQRLSAAGIEQWPHNGVLVADLALSSTTDYGLAVDADGNALLAFQDTRFGGTKITVARVAPDGSLAWGAGGVQVSLGNGASPRVAALADGSIVAAWTEGSDLRRQKLSSTGAIQWAAGGLFELPPGGNSDLICDLVAADGGTCIISRSRNPSRFLHAQKFDAAGAPVWNGGSPVVVFDGSALQFGYFPPFLHDDAGGAVFGWYETGGTRNAYVQRISAAGAELFPHNGVAVSTMTAGRIRLTPWLVFDQAAGDSYLFWTESNTLQTMWGLYGQKLNALGERKWTDSGRELLPLGTQHNSFIRAALRPGGAGGAMIFYFDQSVGTRIWGMSVNSNGDFLWAPSSIEVCSVPGTKSRLDMARDACGRALLVWGDLRGGASDIYGQNVNPDGTLGHVPVVGDLNGDCLVSVGDLLLLLAAWGACPDCPKVPCPADLSGDCMVDVTDLLALLANWS